MVTSKATLQLIRNIIAKHYARLTLSVLGRNELTDNELSLLQSAGYDISNRDSLLSLVYNHVFLNPTPGTESPTSLEDMRNEQATPGIKPEGSANTYVVAEADDNMKQLIVKLKQDVAARIENLIRENNQNFRLDSLANMERSDYMDHLIKESSVGKLKQLLRDTAKDGNRDWSRIAVTEMSNLIGIGSLDRIITDNRHKDVEDIYVYRIAVNDAATCKWCRKFYIDEDGSPKVYRLSHLMANGSNMGKKRDDWQPCVQATHPNERCSSTLELKPGWKVRPGGKVDFIGVDAWHEYIKEKAIG